MPPDDPRSSVSPDAIEAALATVRASRPEDYDGHTEFARLTSNERLTWLEAAVCFVQSSKSVRRPFGEVEPQTPRPDPD